MVRASDRLLYYVKVACVCRRVTWVRIPRPKDPLALCPGCLVERLPPSRPDPAFWLTVKRSKLPAREE